MTDQPTSPIALIGGGPGAWDLITVRGMHRLQEAEVILADHLGPAPELDKLCDVSTKEVIDVSKLPYGRQVAQEKINQLLVDYARQGKRVVRLKGGDPFVFGRGFEELQALAEAGFSCEVIPGITSAIAVPELVGIPITQRGMVHSFSVISGHLPPGHAQSLNNWQALAQTRGTLAVIMGVKNAGKIADELMRQGMSETTPVVIIQEGSTSSQRVLRCDVAHLGQTMAEEAVQPPAVYMIGEVASLEAPVRHD